MGNSANATFSAAMNAVTIRSRSFRRIGEPFHVINYNIAAIEYSIDLRYAVKFCKSFQAKRFRALKGTRFSWFKIKTYGRKRRSQTQINYQKAYSGLLQK